CGKSGTSQKEVNFSDSDVTITQRNYAKPGCSDELSSSAWTYSYTVGNEIGKTDTLTNLGTSDSHHAIKEFDLELKSTEFKYQKPSNKKHYLSKVNSLDFSDIAPRSSSSFLKSNSCFG